MKKLLFLLPVIAVFTFSCMNNAEDNTGDPQEDVSYSSQIQPIFISRCVSCHGTNSGLNLSSYSALMNSVGDQYGENIVIPFDADASGLVDKIEANPQAGTRMPQGQTPLSGDQIELIRTWITEGAENN